MGQCIGNGSIETGLHHADTELLPFMRSSAPSMPLVCAKHIRFPVGDRLRYASVCPAKVVLIDVSSDFQAIASHAGHAPGFPLGACGARRSGAGFARPRHRCGSMRPARGPGPTVAVPSNCCQQLFTAFATSWAKTTTLRLHDAACCCQEASRLQECMARPVSSASRTDSGSVWTATQNLVALQAPFTKGLDARQGLRYRETRGR